MNIDYTLYLATDRALLGGRDLCAVVTEAVAHGVTMVQLREKTCSGKEFHSLGQRLLAATRRLGVPLIVNDRVDIMLALEADGIHVGRHDLPLLEVRRLSPGKIVGYSVTNAEDLALAERLGADYVGIGPVFTTSTKPDADAPLGLEGLRALASRARVPCVAIGGLNLENAAAVAAVGVAGLCTISTILTSQKIGDTVRRFRQAIDAGRRLPASRGGGMAAR